MSANFAFLPRKVARPKSQPKLAPAQLPIASSSTQPDSDSLSKPKLKEPATTNEDLVALVLLSLSDYALWSNPDLRRTLEWKSRSHEGFIPLSYVLTNSTLIEKSISEVVVAKALRALATNVIDVRMRVQEATQSAISSAGTYEIRRKDWETILEHPTRTFTKSDWDLLTIYAENIPHHIRTIPAISRFMTSLLPVSEDAKVQHISLLPHFNDQPGSIPKFKGFALITLASSHAVEYLSDAWPWARKKQQKNVAQPEQEHEARKFGFRVLPKLRWEELNQEYIAYQRALIDISAPGLEEGENADEEMEYATEPPAQQVVLEYQNPKTQHNAAYPINCLVFVRNIHPETNKTTLRALFTPAAHSGVDYVDFTKGLDSCHLRLSTPTHAESLIKHFSTNSFIQASGLDDLGIPATTKSIMMELVQGRKEEVYWEKVPEKVRKAAVAKALGKDVEETAGAGGASKWKKRKRNEGS